MIKRHIFLTCTLLALSILGKAQFSSQLPSPDRYIPEQVIDSTYGITMYEKLNMRLSWDSVRNCKGYACSGWVKDYYTNGRLLHKGYYDGGQLRIYTNYYPDGKIERNFRVVDDLRSEMKVYFQSGNLKSKVRYIDSEPIKWEDFYDSGQLSYYEEHHKSFEYYLNKVSYFEDGSPRAVLALENKKKKLFDKREYHNNKKIKLRGKLVYDKKQMDYVKVGTWEYYDENGKITRAEMYEAGHIANEKEY